MVVDFGTIILQKTSRCFTMIRLHFANVKRGWVVIQGSFTKKGTYNSFHVWSASN
jgi:hypothetical protein